MNELMYQAIMNISILLTLMLVAMAFGVRIPFTFMQGLISFLGAFLGGLIGSLGGMFPSIVGTAIGATAAYLMVRLGLFGWLIGLIPETVRNGVRLTIRIIGAIIVGSVIVLLVVVILLVVRTA